MGMFDWVETKPEKCPVCGEEIKDFQSKNGFKKGLIVTPEQLIEDSRRLWGEIEVEYYGYCDTPHCGAVFYTYSFDDKKWKREYLTYEQLYGEET